MTDSIPRYLLSKGLSRIRPDAFWGPAGSLRYRDVDPPDLPNEEWVRIRTIYGGICGSDLGSITLHTSVAMTVFTSFPFTLGHENVGRIAELGSAVEGFEVGDRVVVNPLLSFGPRGLENPYVLPENHCDLWDRGVVSPGTFIGFCRDTGGSWSAEFVAHRSQLLPVPESLSDEEAVLAEPFGISIHGVLDSMPEDDDTVLVIGGGVIGLGVIAALRALDSKCRIVALARYGFQADRARELGADVVLGKSRGTALERNLCRVLGARMLTPALGPDVVVGGADVVFDCVGTSGSFDQALRFAATGGTVSLIGVATHLDGIDWTPLWLNELTIRGSFAYDFEEWCGERSHAMDRALRLMAEKKADLRSLVTHRFALDDYREALSTVTSKGNSGVIKAVFDFRDQDD